jgi:hypothetical protein
MTLKFKQQITKKLMIISLFIFIIITAFIIAKTSVLANNTGVSCQGNEKKDGVFLYKDKEYKGDCVFYNEKKIYDKTANFAPNSIKINGKFSIKLSSVGQGQVFYVKESLYDLNKIHYEGSKKSTNNAKTLYLQTDNIEIILNPDKSTQFYYTDCSKTTWKGVYAYSDKNFQGKCIFFNQSFKNLDTGTYLDSDDNDEISSFKITGDFTVKFFKDSNYEGKKLEYTPPPSKTLEVSDLSEFDDEISSLQIVWNNQSNPKNSTVTTPTNSQTSTTPDTKTDPNRIVVTLTTSEKAEKKWSVKEIDDDKNKLYDPAEKAYPKITAYDIEEGYEVVLFDDAVLIFDTLPPDTKLTAEDLALGTKLTAGKGSISTDYIKKYYVNSTSSPDGATETGGTGSGNTGSGGYTGPGGVAGNKQGRKIPVPNLNYPLSSPPILPNVRNPGNLPFIHDPELSEMTDMSKYGTIKNETAYQAFQKAIEFGIKTLIKLVGVSSLFGITYGLVHYAIAHGETELQEKGTKMILWSIVGLILSLISHAIVTGLMQFLTGVGTINI